MVMFLEFIFNDDIIYNSSVSSPSPQQKIQTSLKTPYDSCLVYSTPGLPLGGVVPLYAAAGCQILSVKVPFDTKVVFSIPVSLQPYSRCEICRPLTESFLWASIQFLLWVILLISPFLNSWSEMILLLAYVSHLLGIFTFKKNHLHLTAWWSMRNLAGWPSNQDLQHSTDVILFTHPVNFSYSYTCLWPVWTSWLSFVIS